MKKKFSNPVLYIKWVETSPLCDSDKQKYLTKNLITDLLTAGNLDKAIEITNLITEANIRGKIFLDIAEHLRKTGNNDRAEEIDEKAMINFRLAIDDIDETIKLANEKNDLKIKDSILF